MRTVGLKILKNKLSEYVKLASRGETILVSDRDRVVAEIVPPRESRSPLVSDALLADAIRHGLLTPALSPPGPPPERSERQTGLRPLKEILADLDEDRAER